MKLLSVISTHHIVTIVIHNFAKTGKHFKEIVRISQKPHESLLSFISVNYNTNIILFYFHRRKNKKTNQHLRISGNVTFLSQHWLVELIANMISFHLKYGRGFIQFTTIIVLLLLNESCSAEGEDKKTFEQACQYWLTNDFTHNVVWISLVQCLMKNVLTLKASFNERFIFTCPFSKTFIDIAGMVP